MRKIKIAQIGTSETAHAAHIMNAMLNMPDTFEVLGVADVDYHSGPLDPVFSRVPHMSVEELLSLPLDAVNIDCDEELQTYYGMMAAERGFHLSFDKPGSQPDSEFDALVDKVKEKNLVFHVNYMYRYNPAVMYAMDKIARGEIGDIVSIEAQMNVWHDNYIRGRHARFSGGVMYYLGCHMTDIIYRILGEPLDVTTFNSNTGFGGVDSCDFGMAVLRYPLGSSIAKVNATEVGGAPLRRSLIFCGSKGTLEIRPIERPVANGFDVSEIYETYLGDGNIRHTTFAPYGRYTKMLSEFAAMVRGEKENPYTYEYERKLHKLILRTCDYKF